MTLVTREQARVAIVTRVEYLRSTWSGVSYLPLVEYDNRKIINYSTQAQPFLCVSIEYHDGMQVDLGPSGTHRNMGSILLEAMCREGSGSKDANNLLDHFYRHMHMTDLMAPVRTYAAKLVSGRVRQGWQPEAAVIPFWYDTANF